jgi:hypothetical protein
MDRKRTSALDAEAEAGRQRRLEAMHLQEIEDNPLDAEDVAMFEMFDREGWSSEERRDHIRREALKTSFPAAAE